MRGRPLCAASVLVIGILFVWHFFSSDNGMMVQKEEMAVTCQVEQIVGRGDKMSLIVCDVMRGREAFCERMKVYGGNDRVLFNQVKIGQILSMEGKVSSFSRPGNPGQFNEYSYYRELGISYKYFARALTIQNASVSTREQALHELRLKWCENLYRCLPEEEAGIASAMVFGEKSGLTTEIKELYKRNGIVHILAISGVKTLSLVSLVTLKKSVNSAFIQIYLRKITLFYFAFWAKFARLSFCLCSEGAFPK